MLLCVLCARAHAAMSPKTSCKSTRSARARWIAAARARCAHVRTHGCCAAATAAVTRYDKDERERTGEKFAMYEGRNARTKKVRGGNVVVAAWLR
jgi:hypothetical protein